MTRTANEFCAAFDRLPESTRGRRSTLRAALLVSPIGFRVNEESATDNAYMNVNASVDLERAHAQHQGLAKKLGEIGVPVIVLPGREGLDDGIYPNNVFATIAGRLIVGSMRHPVRRREAEREDVRSLFSEAFNYEVVDLSALDCVAELTGPLVVDRARQVGFCGMTERVDEAGYRALENAFDLALSYRFDLVDSEYHTNLVLSILAGRACVIYPPAFVDASVPETIRRCYPDTTLVLDDEEKAAFAGNCLAITDRDVLFSTTSLKKLRPRSREALESWGFRIHGSEVDELEKGGGSLRCLIAEVY